MARSTRVRTRAILAAALLASGCGTVIQTPIQRDRARAQQLLPATLRPRDPPATAPRALSVRIYGDDTYRRSTLGWELRVFRQVERANELLASQFGVKLEIESIKPWDRPRGIDSLESALEELERFDPGGDVDLVIGLVEALPMVTPAMHQLGMARVLGRHLVMRGTDDIAEHSAIAHSLQFLSEDERGDVYSSRVRHKEVVLLLHELGHVLGALHVREPTAIMHPTHGRLISGFSPTNAGAIQVALGGRGEGRRDLASVEAARLAMVTYFEQNDWLGWLDLEREEMLALLRGDRTMLARNPGEPPPGLDTGDPRADAEQLMRQRRFTEAWKILDPLAAANPKDAVAVRWACVAGAYAAPTSKPARARCEAAVAAAQDDALARLWYATVLLAQSEPEAAEREAKAAEARFTEVDGSPEAWSFLAYLYQELGAPTWAERAAKRGGDTREAEEVLEWVARIRAKRLPASAKIPEAREAEYLRGLDTLDAHLAADRFAEAQKWDDKLRRRFPAAPPRDAAFCIYFGDRKRFSRAQPFCARARARDPNDERPRLVLAIAAFATERPAAAVEPLQEAVALVPDRKEVWTLLAAAHRAAGRPDRAADVAESYRARFGEVMP